MYAQLTPTAAVIPQNALCVCGHSYAWHTVSARCCHPQCYHTVGGGHVFTEPSAKHLPAPEQSTLRRVQGR